jgi:hypothetical protein
MTSQPAVTVEEREDVIEQERCTLPPAIDSAIEAVFDEEPSLSGWAADDCNALLNLYLAMLRGRATPTACQQARAKWDTLLRRFIAWLDQAEELCGVEFRQLKEGREGVVAANGTPSRGQCTGCGLTTDVVNSADLCLDCENVQLSTDIYAVDVALGLVEAAVREALGQNYVHPDDVLTRVGEVIRELGQSRAEPTVDLHRRYRRNLDSRIMRREASASIGSARTAA